MADHVPTFTDAGHIVVGVVEAGGKIHSRAQAAAMTEIAEAVVVPVAADASIRTITRDSATQFTITAADNTADFPAGSQAVVYEALDTTNYAILTVVSAEMVSTNTVVTFAETMPVGVNRAVGQADLLAVTDPGDADFPQLAATGKYGFRAEAIDTVTQKLSRTL